MDSSKLVTKTFEAPIFVKYWWKAAGNLQRPFSSTLAEAMPWGYSAVAGLMKSSTSV
jgi:hypothetical protein